MKASLTLAAGAGHETESASLGAAELALVDAARKIIALRRKPEWHSVGCALRTRSGRIFTSVHVGAYVGRIDVCAEAIAIGMGAAEGDTDIESIVAVNKEADRRLRARRQRHRAGTAGRPRGADRQPAAEQVHPPR
jgi:hypothetical protein